MAETIRVGIIGTGGISRTQAKGLQKLDDVEIVAGCDINEEALNEFAEMFEVSHKFSDYNEMVQLGEMDAVSVCTPNFLHKDPTIMALKAGKHVMVEKPMAMNAQEAQAMIDAAKASGKSLVIGFQARLGANAKVLKRFIDDGELGNILYARVQALRRYGVPSWGVFGQKELQGGGPLIDIGIHAMECAHYLMGEPRPVAASAQTFTYLGDKPCEVDCPWGPWDHETYTVEDLAVGFIRFDNGATMSVESSFVAHLDEPGHRVRLMGEKGGCTLNPPAVFRNMAGTMVNIEPAFVPKYRGMDRKMEEWIAYLRGEQETECPAEAGLMLQKMLDALYQSAEEGREVAID